MYRFMDASYIKQILRVQIYIKHLSLGNLALANLNNSNLSNANLDRADFFRANLSGANLMGSNLRSARLIDANLNNANLNECEIYGISVWGVQLENTSQENLTICETHKYDSPIITIDNIEVAQFVFLLLNNERIRNIIDTITSKVVLILGRFTLKRKKILLDLKMALKHKGYCPIIFDFEIPSNRDTHETITTLARLSRFVIADISDPKSVPQELVSIVQDLPSVTVQPIIEKGDKPWGMFDHIKRYPWVLPVYQYSVKGRLVSELSGNILNQIEANLEEMRINYK